jgi:hypothetical protein
MRSRIMACRGNSPHKAADDGPYILGKIGLASHTDVGL